MSSLSRQCINSFIEELNTRKKLYSSASLTANLDNSGYESLKKITSDFFDKSPDEIIEEDLKSVDKKVLAKMLILTGEEKDTVNYFIAELDNHPNYYNIMMKQIILFAKEYKSIDDSQTKLIRNKISVLQEYIDRFSKTTQEELFDNLEDVHKLLDTGFSDEIKYGVEKFIGLSNISNINQEDVEFNSYIVSKYDIVKDFFLDDDIMSILNTILSKSIIDIDLIPTIAEECSKKTNIDSKVLQDLIAMGVANTMLLDYDVLNDDEYETEKKEKRQQILDVLNFIVPIHQRIVYKVYDIYKENEEYINAYEKENKYQDMTLSEINSQIDNFDLAIKLKEREIFEAMAETLNNIETIEINSEEYDRFIDMLIRLVQAYNDIERKRDEPTLRIK